MKYFSKLYVNHVELLELIFLFCSPLQCSGYLPPEYVYQGIYSTKSDVYSFGVLLLQIISGKRSNRLHGPHESLNLQEYVSYLETMDTAN